MPEFDDITVGIEDNPVLGEVRYSVARIISAVCPKCGNPDCEEIEQFKDRLREKIKHEASR